METATPRLTDDTPAMAVLDAIAACADSEPSALDTPLYTAIDPDALDAVLDSEADVAVTFQYDGYVVTVQSDGAIEVNGDSVGGASA